MRHVIAAAALLSLSVAGAASAQELTPRDAFWSASDLVSVSSNPGAKAKSATPPKSNASAVAHAKPTSHVLPQLVAENGYGEAPHLVQTSFKTQQLGLRYSVLLKQVDGTYAEAASDASFHDGDDLRLTIMSNEPGYLYVIQQGSSGNWSPIFPGPAATRNSNRIEQGRVYQIPDGAQSFRMNNQPGTEKLFVLLSRQPIQNLDNSVQRLQTPSDSAPPSTSQGQVLEASNHISDAFVQQLASRDLTLVTEQKVDSTSKGNGSGERAVYVVAKPVSGSPSGEVVAQITLNHQ